MLPSIKELISKTFPLPLRLPAEYDPLHHEAEKYGNSLRQAGVNVISKCFPEVIHGFLDLPIYEEDKKIGFIEAIGDLLKNIIDNK